MTHGKATTYEALMAALVTQIHSVTGIALPLIIPTLSEDYFEPGGHGDKYVLISNFSGTKVAPVETGGGTDWEFWNTTQDIVLVTRLDVDTPGRDYQRLTQSSLGLLTAWRTLLKGLEQWNPDDGGTPAIGLLCEPARTYGFSIRPRGQSKIGWVQIRTKLQLIFHQDLS